MPPPAAETQPILNIVRPDLMGDGFGGNVFWDGSCSIPGIEGTERAAWAAVITDDAGRPIAELSGLVPSDLPQTPQAAEF